MKTLSGTSKAVILVAIGVVALLSLRAFAQPNRESTEPPKSKATFVLKIKNVTPVKDAARFEDILKHLKTQLYDVVMHEENGAQKHLLPGSSAKLDIKTDKVTTSEAAKNAPTGEVTRMTRQPGETRQSGMTRQPRVTRQIASMYSSDIKAILDELQ
jgi:hypothetical protein